MGKPFLLILVILLVSLFNSNFIYTQDTDCTRVLEDAKQLYQQGLIERIPGMLSDCINDGFNREQQLEAYRLIILTYIFDDEEMKADSVMYDFIKRFPDYEILSSDPMEFVYLYNSYITLPLYSLGIKAGLNLTQMFVSEHFSTSDLNASKRLYKPGGVGYQFGLSFNRFINEKIQISFDPLIMGLRYNTTDNTEFLGIENSEIIYTEKQTRVNIPISATYDFFHEEKLHPFVRLGAGVGLTLSAEADIERNYTDNSLNQNLAGSRIDVLQHRNETNVYALIGGGLKYQLPKGYLVVDMRYSFDFTNQLERPELFSNDDLVYKYQYLHDATHLSNLTISVGYMYSFFVTRKKSGN